MHHFSYGTIDKTFLVLIFSLSLILVSGPTYAVPSFSSQTGQACAACHVGAFGPQLTPFGRNFKLNGYTMTDGESHGAPVSMMLESSFTKTEKPQNPPPSGFGPNSNFSLDQVSAFYAGAVTSEVGAFIQTTYDGVEKAFHWDNADVRYAHASDLFGQDYVAGISVNNSPTIQDLWNSTPAWRFPYSSSALATSITASTLIDGALAQQVLGATAFVNIDDFIFLESGAYHGLSGNIRNTLGALPVTGTDTYDGPIPYWRVALNREFNGEKSLEFGAYGLAASRYPEGIQTSGTDRFVDNAIDANGLVE